jgi:hypothetical protein
MGRTVEHNGIMHSGFLRGIPGWFGTFVRKRRVLNQPLSLFLWSTKPFNVYLP